MDAMFVILREDYKEYIEEKSEELRTRVNEKLKSKEVTSPHVNTFDTFKKIVEILRGKLVEHNSLSVPAEYAPTDDGEMFTIHYRNGVTIEELAHELGHHCLHMGEKASHDHGLKPKKEIEANYFAKCFLLPRTIFKETVIAKSDNGQCDIVSLANEFSVSYLFAESRGNDLHIWGESNG